MAGEVAKIKVYNPLKQRSGLTGKKPAICHYSYNLPLCPSAETNQKLICFPAKRSLKPEAITSGDCEISTAIFSNNEKEYNWPAARSFWFVTAFETEGGIPVTRFLFTQTTITIGAVFQRGGSSRQ